MLLVILAVIASWIWRSGVAAPEPDFADAWVAPEQPSMIFNYDVRLLVPPGLLRVEAFHASGLVGEGSGIVPDRPGPRVPVDVWLQFQET